MRRVTAVLAAIAIALLAACSASGQSDGTESGPLAVWRSDDFGEQALLADEGTLQVGNECVVVEHDGRATTLAWPSGLTEWREDRGTIMFRGEELRDGDVVRVGGSGEGVGIEWLQEPDAECPDRRWFVSSVDVMQTTEAEEEPRS